MSTHYICPRGEIRKYCMDTPPIQSPAKGNVTRFICVTCVFYFFTFYQNHLIYMPSVVKIRFDIFLRKDTFYIRHFKQSIKYHTCYRLQDIATLLTEALTICLWLGPPWFNYWFSFTLAYSRISHEYSSLFIIAIDFYVFALMH